MQNGFRFGVDNILTIYDHGQFTKINRPDGSLSREFRWRHRDREENVWVSVTGRDQRLFRIHDLRVMPDSNPVPFPRFLAADPAGGIWLSSIRNLGRGNGKLRDDSTAGERIHSAGHGG